MVEAVERYEDLLRIKSNKVEWEFNAAVNHFRTNPTKTNYGVLALAALDMMTVQEKIDAARIAVALEQKKSKR